MKSKLRNALWLVVILLSIECVLWCRSNVATIRSSSELQALREIAQSYGMAVPSDFEAVLLRTGPGPNRGTTKTYRVSTGSGEEASIAISEQNGCRQGARRLSVVSATSCARRRLIRSVAPTSTPLAMPIEADSAAIVQRQLDAYNSRDIEALLATYADDAEVFEHPSTLLASGAAALRERFTARLKEPNLYARLLSRTVIDYEEVFRTFPEGSGSLRLIMIYEISGDRIARAWSIAGEKTLD
jgi:hypothetical protein